MGQTKPAIRLPWTYRRQEHLPHQARALWVSLPKLSLWWTVGCSFRASCCAKRSPLLLHRNLYPLASSCSPGSPTRTQGDRCRQSRRCRIDRCGAVGVENDLHCACKFYTHGPTSLGRSPTTAQRAWSSLGSPNHPFPACPSPTKDRQSLSRDRID